MRRTLPLIMGLTVATALFLAAPTVAHNAGPCTATDDPGHSEYAAHHIVFMASAGDLGAVDHDGDGMAHAPGIHQGFSTCEPTA